MAYEWDNKKPTAQMLGRWQPFHDGHYALFQEIVKKTGQVCIQIRDVQGVDDNPFDFDTVKKNIEEKLRDHALFTGFAPIEDPQVAIAIIVENEGSGSSKAAPLARELLDEYFIKNPVEANITD